MIFTVNTKPLITAVAQVVIDSNINKFYRKSNLLQITATDFSLILNTEASYIMSEAVIGGMSNVDNPDGATTIFVDAAQFKKLINTFEADQLTLEFTENALVVRCGKSKFSIPKLVDENDVELNKPITDLNDRTSTTVSTDKWAFIKNRQMFAVSEEPTYPVYRYVWFSENGEVLTGDYNKSLFTRSNMGDIAKTCLLSPTIVNLITNLPEGAKLYAVDTDYIIYYTCDTYNFVAQFSPQYESEDFGVYSGDIILGMCDFVDENAPIEIDCDAISRFINQIDILNTNPDAKIWLKVGGDGCKIYNNTSEMSFDSKSAVEYEVEFKMRTLKPVIAKYSGKIKVYPVIQDDITTAIKLVDEKLVTLVGAND